MRDAIMRGNIEEIKALLEVSQNSQLSLQAFWTFVREFSSFSAATGDHLRYRRPCAAAMDSDLISTRFRPLARGIARGPVLPIVVESHEYASCDSNRGQQPNVMRRR
jgi:hypothetical protein